ncbi:MAG: HAMP domain-containing sensor histidine kinase [Clostridium sp.]
MYLKNKWNDMGIKPKVFISSAVIITISFMLLYMCIYLFMPRVYETYRVSKISSNISALEKKLGEDEKVNLEEVLDEFSYDNNLELILAENSESGYAKNVVYTSMKGGIKNTNKIPLKSPFDEEVEYKNGIRIVKGMPQNREGSLNIEKTLYVKSLHGEYTMAAHVAVSPATEVRTVVALFFPFAIVAILLIALIISMFYARSISKPLIKINDVAKKIAGLDFDDVIEVKSNDEIGQLSNSINLMNKNVKESFDRMAEEIERERALEKERKEFIATISHELKSPITVISGQLEGMMYNIGKYKDRDKYLKESYEVTQNMKDLVQEILYLSERSNIDYKFNLKEVNISDLIIKVRNELIFFIEDKKINLEIDVECDVIVMAEEKLIKKVIMNIIKNAVTHSPENEKIIIKLKDRVFTVENMGVTISEKDINELFNAFYRVDKSRNRKTGGSGLGLYIVKTILDKHEGFKYNIRSKKNSVIFKIEF